MWAAGSGAWANMPPQEQAPDPAAHMSIDASATDAAAPIAKIEEDSQVPQLPLNKPNKRQQAGSSKESGPAATETGAPVPEKRPVTLFSAFAAGSTRAKEEASGGAVASSAPAFPPEGTDSLPETQPGLVDALMEEVNPAKQELAETQSSQQQQPQQQHPPERRGKRQRGRRDSNAVPEEAAVEETATKKNKSTPSLQHFFAKRPAVNAGEAATVLADAQAALDELNSVPAKAEEEVQPSDDAKPVLEFPLTQLLEAAG